MVIIVKGKHQGDVDVDALADQGRDGRDAGSGGRDFDHDVGAVNGRVQTPDFGNCAFRIVGQLRIGF